MKTTGWTNATPTALAALVDKYKGRAGDAEAEAVLSWTKWESPEYIEFYTRRGADLGPLVERCGSAVLCFHDDDEGGVTLRLSPIVWRGFHMAFRRVDNRNPGSFPGQSP